MRTPRKLWFAAVFAIAFLGSAAAQKPRESLTQLKLDKTTITAATLIPAGWFKFPQPTTIATPSVDLGAHCRVEAVVRLTSDSEISLKSGCLPARGHATAATDDGHTGPDRPDASWARGHPEKIIDFGYRAVHQTAVQSKAILNAFYGKNPTRGYFDGCSDGGREALMEAQRFPKDFDGIIVGAPANYWIHLFAGFIWNEKALMHDPASWIAPNKLPAIQRAALAACDSLDGVKDGLVEDPRRCHFDPPTIQCQGSDAHDCLTAAQVDALKKIYSGPKNPRTGEMIFPGYVPGDEVALWNWPFWIAGLTSPKEAAQAQFGNALFGDMVFENPKWAFRTLDFDKDVALADQKIGPLLNSNDPNLKPFKANGGKLLQYHGWSDGAIAPLNSINYYEQVVAELSGSGTQKDSLSVLGDFYRLFMAPGVGHCGGGSGPDSFGDLALSSRAQLHDPDHDVLNALEQWVENGKAPEKIIATKYVGGDPKKGIAMTWPLCPYPQMAQYKGSGDSNDAANFACVVSKENN